MRAKARLVEFRQRNERGTFVREPMSVRFWRGVAIGAPGECWKWLAAKKDGTGYGRISSGARHALAHRYSWELHFGPIPEGMKVCHRCDNPQCVNPGHLFLGSQKDNKRDCMEKHRHAFGERHGKAKLTEEQVRQIRELCASGVETHEQIGARFGVSKPTVGFINTRRSWRHL